MWSAPWPVASEPWCRLAVVDPDGREVATCLVTGPVRPTLAAVDLIAHLALAARKMGGRARLDEASPEMRGLLDLSGLLVEVEREAEGGEEPVGIHWSEEEVHSGDPPG
jgi:hypothetical protein